MHRNLHFFDQWRKRGRYDDISDSVRMTETTSMEYESAKYLAYLCI